MVSVSEHLGGSENDTESVEIKSSEEAVGLPTLILTLMFPKLCLLNVQGLLSHF